MRTTETDRVVSSLPPTFPTLRLLYAPGLERRIVSLHRDQTFLGREVSDDQGVALPDDNRASRQHARIELGVARQDGAPPTVCITDLDSKNGTFINGRPVQTAWLADGDVIRVGDSLLLLRFEAAHREDAIAEPLYGEAPVMRTLRRQLHLAAQNTSALLLCGETGSGKEVAAQAFHRLSRRPGELVAVNCAAIPAELAESELFGHVEGAFSGARRAQGGYFRAADGRTLFLDEIGELPPAIQPKLLRALELREITPVGATKSIAVDVRVVAATNRSLPEAVRAGLFRDDLYARLRGTEIMIPPLRARREDIFPLLDRRLGAALVSQPGRLSPRLAEALILYHWPHNVRELVQMAEVLALHTRQGDPLDLHLVAERLRPIDASNRVADEPRSPAAEQSAASPSMAMPTLDPDATRLSREVLARLAEENDWNVSKLARLVGRSRRQVRRWLQQYGLSRRGSTDAE